MQVDGMTSEGGLAMMDIFLGQALKSEGVCFEFGTYKGRTAALSLQAMAGSDHWLHLVDPSDYLDTATLNGLSQRYTWHKERSEPFCQEKLDSVLAGKRIVYTHHDASHFFSNVKTELSEVVRFMSDGGVIVLDDFNDSYSQVRAAYYYLRYVEKFPFELLVIGFNKAILVHQTNFDENEQYVLIHLLDDLESAGLICKLYRTDINEHSRNFFVGPRLATDEKLYGTRFFGDRFYRHSKVMLKK
jgi:hypothetical protein